MVEQSVPADSVSTLRESALAAAGVRGIFRNLIDGKSVSARNTLDVLDPATGELLSIASSMVPYLISDLRGPKFSSFT